VCEHKKYAPIAETTLGQARIELSPQNQAQEKGNEKIPSVMVTFHEVLHYILASWKTDQESATTWAKLPMVMYHNKLTFADDSYPSVNLLNRFIA